MKTRILFFLSALFAGTCRGVFEVVILFDTIGGKFSYKLFCAPKNGAWEWLFPVDYTHRIKLLEVAILGLCAVLAFYSESWYFKVGKTFINVTAMCLFICFWAAYSTGFLIAFQVWR
jgi:hypothetical protein